VKVELSWVNNLPTTITDAEIEMTITGNVLKKESISTSQGFYDLAKEMIRWDKQTLENLAEIKSGKSGRSGVRFSLKPLSLKGDALRDPTIVLHITAKGKRLSETNVPETIERSITRVIKVQSEVTFSQSAVYSIGPFGNTGPFPPQVEKPTTYTVLWSLTNSSATVKNGVARGILAPNVRWLDKALPFSEKVNYDAKSRTVEWAVGTVSPGAGFLSSPREIAFQVELIPSVSQIQTEPTLVSDTVFTGSDEFTMTAITAAANDATTRISTDPDFDFGKDRVIP
jgi:hypothetical protein